MFSNSLLLFLFLFFWCIADCSLFISTHPHLGGWASFTNNKKKKTKHSSHLLSNSRCPLFLKPSPFFLPSTPQTSQISHKPQALLFLFLFPLLPFNFSTNSAPLFSPKAVAVSLGGRKRFFSWVVVLKGWNSKYSRGSSSLGVEVGISTLFLLWFLRNKYWVRVTILVTSLNFAICILVLELLVITYWPQKIFFHNYP